MGLDMWIKARSKGKSLEAKEDTGVCSGLIGISLKAPDEFYEIGYFRKAYDQQDAILSVVSKEVIAENEEPALIITKSSCEKLLEISNSQIKDIECMVEEGTIQTVDDDEGELGTWCNYYKWETLRETMQKALDLFSEDPNTLIIYQEWF